MTTPSNDEGRKGVQRKIPDGFYTRGEVSKITGISVASLRRWRDTGHVVPVRIKEYGQVTVSLYSSEQVESLLADPPYQKPGRPPKEKAT